MSESAAAGRLFAKRRAKAGTSGNVLEIVSYWDNTLLDIDLLQAGAKNQRSEFISFSESGCTVHLLPDMQAHLKKADQSIAFAEANHMQVGKDEVMHIKHGNLDFVLMFVQIPPVTLPQLTRRDIFYSFTWFASTLLYLTAAVLIYRNNAVQPVEPDDIWAPLDISFVSPPPPLPKVKPVPMQPRLETKPVPPPQPPPPDKLVQEKTTVPAPPAAPKANAAPPKTNAASPKANAASPKAQESGSSLSGLNQRLGDILQKTGNTRDPIGFKGSNDSDRRQAGATIDGPGLNAPKGVDLDGAKNAAETFGSRSGAPGLKSTLGAEGDGQGRARVPSVGSDPVTGGGLASTAVQTVIRAHLNQIRHCYDVLLQRNPSAEGKVKVNFVIGGDGYVTQATVTEDSLGDSGLAGCITSTIQKWKFPVPQNSQPVNVNYPFIFHPR